MPIGSVPLGSAPLGGAADESGGSGAAVTFAATRPGWLVQIGTSTRLSSFGTTNMLGQDWTGTGFAVSGIRAAGNLNETGGQVVLDDADLAWTASHLLGGLSGVDCSIWFVANADDMVTTPPRKVFVGHLDNSRAAPMRAIVTAQLVPTRPGLLKTPRLTMGPETGMTRAVPAGTVMRFGTAVITVEDSRK